MVEVVQAARSEECDRENRDDQDHPHGRVGDERGREVLRKEGAKGVRERERVHDEKGVHGDSDAHDGGGERAQEVRCVAGSREQP